MYRLQVNWQFVSTNRASENLLKASVDNQGVRSWDRALSHCLMAYWSSGHASTAQSPFFLKCGCELRLPTDMCLPGLVNVTTTAHDFAVAVEKLCSRSTRTCAYTPVDDNKRRTTSC